HLLRIKRKRGKWIAALTFTLPAPESTPERGVTRGGPGREDSRCCLRLEPRGALPRQRALPADEAPSLPGSPQEAPGQRASQATRHAPQAVATRRAPSSGAGHGPDASGTARWQPPTDVPAHGLHRPWSERSQRQPKDNRLIATWPCYQFSPCMACKAERLGTRLEQVDAACTKAQGRRAT